MARSAQAGGILLGGASVGLEAKTPRMSQPDGSKVAQATEHEMSECTDCVVSEKMRLDIKNSATTDRIALAAAQLFARQGYHGTSIREIARLADVSENTLFRHFDHKEDIFWSAIRAHASGLKLRRDVQEGIAKCDSPEVVLPKVFELLAHTASFRPELPRLIAVAFLELNWKANSFCQEYISPFLLTINRYVETNIKNGRLRDLDPLMVTASLMMTALMHPGISLLIDAGNPPFSDSRDAGQAYAKFWLDVLAPRVSPYTQTVASRADEIRSENQEVPRIAEPAGQA